MENLPKNLASLLGFGQEQVQKLPLGDHGDPGKLGPVQAHNLTDGFGHVPRAGHRFPAVGKGQQGIRLFRNQLVPPFGRAEILRIPADPILLIPTLKHHLHKGGRGRLGVTAAEHGGLPVGAAGLAVESKGNGVKNTGLSRPGVPGDEVESPLAQERKIHRNLVPVGSKGGHGQCDGSHGSPSQMVSISPRRKSSCSRLMGWLFCSW